MCMCALPNHSALSHHWSAACFPEFIQTGQHTHKQGEAWHPYDLILPTEMNGGEKRGEKIKSWRGNDSKGGRFNELEVVCHVKTDH